MADKEKEWNYAKIQQRLTAEEQRRYEEICRNIVRRNSAVRQSYINRILLGLKLPDKWVTEREVLYFRGEIGSMAVQRKGSVRAPKTQGEEKDRAVNGT